MLTGVVGPGINRKRKAEKSLLDLAKDSTEPGADDFVRAISGDKKAKEETKEACAFTAKQREQIDACLEPILGGTEESQFDILPAATHYVLHCKRLRPVVTIKDIDMATGSLAKRWRVCRVILNLDERFVDIAIAIREAWEKPLPPTNAIALKLCYDIEHDPNPTKVLSDDDWLLTNNIIECGTRFGAVARSAAFDRQINSKNCKTTVVWPGVKVERKFMHDFEVKDENKEAKNDRASVTIHGYTELTIGELRSYQWIDPRRVYDIGVDFVAKTVVFSLRAHHLPLSGVAMEVRAFIDCIN